MGFSDFLRRKGNPDDDNEQSNGDIDPDAYYVLSQEGAKTLLSWARFNAQLCEMIHGADIEDCDDENHKVAMLMPFALHPWLLYYDMLDDVFQDEVQDEDDET